MPRPSAEAKSLDNLASSSAKSISHEKFASRWKNFEAGVKGLSDFSQHINALEIDLDKAKRLESEIQMKTTENSNLKIGRQHMLEGFAKSNKDWEGREARLVETLQVATNEIRDLKSQLADLKGSSVSNEVFQRRVQEVQDEALRKARAVGNENAAEAQRQKRRIDDLEKRRKKLDIELSTKSTILLGTEVELQRYRTDLEERKAETEVEELSADLSVACSNWHYISLIDSLVPRL